MKIILISLTIIVINSIITLSMLHSFSKIIVEQFKQEDKIDEAFKKHIENIYDIIAFNGLVRQKRKRGKVEWYSMTMKRHLFL